MLLFAVSSQIKTTPPKAIAILTMMILVSLPGLAAESAVELSFQQLLDQSDQAFAHYETDKARQYLESAEGRLLNNVQRSELNWRLSRLILAQTDHEDKSRKRERRAGEEALAKAEKAMLLDPGNTGAARWCWKVNMYLAARERGFSCSPFYNRAKAILMRELSRHPQDGELWFFFALLYRQAPRYLFGSKQTAVSAVRYSIRLTPHPNHELILLSELLLELNRTASERSISFTRSKELYHLSMSPLKRIYYYEGVMNPKEMPHLYEGLEVRSISDLQEARLAAQYLAGHLDSAKEVMPVNVRYLEYFKRVAELLNRVDSKED